MRATPPNGQMLSLARWLSEKTKYRRKLLAFGMLAATCMQRTLNAKPHDGTSNIKLLNPVCGNRFYNLFGVYCAHGRAVGLKIRKSLPVNHPIPYL